jgi:hypothetical protein
MQGLRAVCVTSQSTTTYSVQPECLHQDSLFIATSKPPIGAATSCCLCRDRRSVYNGAVGTGGTNAGCLSLLTWLRHELSAAMAMHATSVCAVICTVLLTAVISQAAVLQY